MATDKKKANHAAQKVRKQKIIVAVGGVLFVVVLAIQAPRILELVHGGGGESTAAPYKAFPDEARGPVPGAISISDAGVVALPDRDPQPEPSEGQLVDFELFASKDPFVQQVKLPGDGEAGDSGSDSAGAGAGGGKEGQQQETAPTSATLSVNGVAETVEVGAEFPAADPAFVLVSATKSSVRIGIAGGSLATGDQTVTLRRGKTLTLVNTVDGTEYHLRLVPSP